MQALVARHQPYIHRQSIHQKSLETLPIMSISIDSQLTLVPLSLNDATEIHALIEANKNWLNHHLYWAQTIKRIEDTQYYLADRVLSTQPKNQWFSIRTNGAIVGVFAIKTVTEQGLAELGYWIAETATGKGVVNRIIDKLKKSLFLELNVTSLLFHCAKDNIASQKVAIKAGATKQVLTDKVMELNGQQLQLIAFNGTL